MSSPTPPTYLDERIRAHVPPEGCVVPGSTPVVAFGNARQATVATLGLNPSRVEFLDRERLELPEHRRRLETYRSLGVHDLCTAPGDIVARVLAGCDGYFQRNPYWQWFRPLEELLRGLDASYIDASACHLDLVQWATDPIWRELTPPTRRALITADAAFLRQQLTQERITMLLLNGRGVIDTFSAAYGTVLKVVRRITDQSMSADIVAGFGPRDIVVVGWSANLQSSYGVTHVFRERLRSDVAAQVAILQRSGA